MEVLSMIDLHLAFCFMYSTNLRVFSILNAPTHVLLPEPSLLSSHLVNLKELVLLSSPFLL